METAKKRRDEIRRLCAEQDIAIRPYGNAWWIVGDGVSLIVCDLASLTVDQLRPREVIGR